VSEKNEEKTEKKGPPEKPPEKPGSPFRDRLGRAFNYANNPISIVGIVLTTVAGLSIVTFMVIELAGGFHNPYIGIFAYLILPGIFVAGLVLIPIGMWRRRQRLVVEGVSERERVRFPRLDFNDPGLRRLATLVLFLTAVNAVVFGVSSMMAVEHMESVEFCGTTCHDLMIPEYTTYQESPHSRVSCVECHIGPGASWFVRSKVDGLRQVWRTALDSYERPIETPLETLRPARETCEACHWPAKHYGDKIRIFARFGTDEANTPSYTAMLLKTGGGRLDLGQHGGIHWWHIYSDNRIRYVGSEDLEEIYWVELTTADGEVRIYTRGDEEELPSAEEIEQEAHLMDCIDCHNRPTHIMDPPSNALDKLLQNHSDLAELPYYKREALAAIEDEEYPTREGGMAEVEEAVTAFYRDSYAEVWSDRQPLVEKGAKSAAEVYGRSYFPEMKTSWQTHPNHIGHEAFPGCFRCHDEELATEDGEHVISLDCESCHAFLVEGADTPPDLAELVNG